MSPTKKPITVGSDEWHQLTQRRAALIAKRNREGLTESESVELDRLQQVSRESTIAAFPPGLSALVEEVLRVVAEKERQS